MYRTWWAERRVDGVFLIDLQVHDQRVSALRKLGMPTVVFAPTRGGSLPTVWQDDVAATRTWWSIWLGSAPPAGPGKRHPRYWHTKLRTDALREAARAAGLEAVSVEGDYTGEHGAEATRELLQSARPPTAILYDNDLMRCPA